MRFLKSLGIVIGAIAILAACGPVPVRMTAQEKKLVQVIKINQSVSRPADMFYFGSGQTIGMMFGPIGGAIAGTASLGPAQTIDKYAIENGVKIENIALEEVSTALRESGKLKIAQDMEASAATMNIKVLMFGFSIPNGFSSKFVPIVAVQCELVDSSGKVLWNANDRVSPLGNPVEAMPPDELFKDPKVIERAWAVALRQIARNIVGEL